MQITYTKHWELRNESLDKLQVTVTHFPSFSIIVSRRHSNVSTISHITLLKRLDDVLCVSGSNPSSPRGADICCQNMFVISENVLGTFLQWFWKNCLLKTCDGCIVIRISPTRRIPGHNIPPVNVTQTLMHGVNVQQN